MRLQSDQVKITFTIDIDEMGFHKQASVGDVSARIQFVYVLKLMFILF